ncbi:unnamed protein product [Pocillopora meandrina]|uniref:Uncharacterized protein n=1 Tax=Pocillopora meandrina TaxID=46732 RepID=A0AAU9WHA0_9CNID|nr:unnamed protein product [Pocillopora meandrina]
MAFQNSCIFLLLIFSCFVSVKAVGEGSGKSESASGINLPSFTYEINNLLIYTISKQCKDKDGENHESVLSTIVNKVFEQSGIRGVIINSRISEVFRKKIFSLQKAVKKATGPRYRFKVYYNEVDVHQLKDENSQLRGEKRKLEESLVQEKAKRLRVDEKAREALEKAEKKGAFYKKKFIQLAKKVIKNGKKVLNTETNQYETFNLVGEGELPFTESDPKALDNDDIDNINMWLYLKDKFNISNEAWHEIAIKANGLPNTYSIKKRINELNSKWNLKPTPGDAEGVQLGFAESLQEHIVRLQKNGEINDGEAIKIKLGGDGTNIGKRLTVVNFTFTILNEKDVAMAEKGNYVLAVIKTTETYHNLRDSLADLQMEMSNLKEISANNCTYKIEYFFRWRFEIFSTGMWFRQGK